MAEKQYSQKIVGQQSWRRGANGITVAQAALGVTERAQANIDGLAATKKIVFDLEGSPEAVMLRVRSDGSEDDSNILELYYGRDGDHYLRVGQLVVAQGTQPGPDSTYFGDDIDPSGEVTLFDGEEVSAEGQNGMGLYFVKTLGFDKLVIIASTLTSTTVYVDLVNVNV